MPNEETPGKTDASAGFPGLLAQALTLGARKVTAKAFPTYAGAVIYLGLIGVLAAFMAGAARPEVFMAAGFLGAAVLLLLLLANRLKDGVLGALLAVVVVGAGVAAFYLVRPPEVRTELRGIVWYGDGSGVGAGLPVRLAALGLVDRTDDVGVFSFNVDRATARPDTQHFLVDTGRLAREVIGVREAGMFRLRIPAPVVSTVRLTGVVRWSDSVPVANHRIAIDGDTVATHTTSDGIFALDVPRERIANGVVPLSVRVDRRDVTLAAGLPGPANLFLATPSPVTRVAVRDTVPVARPSADTGTRRSALDEEAAIVRDLQGRANANLALARRYVRDGFICLAIDSLRVVERSARNTATRHPSLGQPIDVAIRPVSALRDSLQLRSSVPLPSHCYGL